jgi:hypothetical protein
MLKMIASKLAETIAPVHLEHPNNFIIILREAFLLATFQYCLNHVTFVSHNVSADHRLQCKCTRVTISWYISTSGSGVVGGSGAAATV